jgi:hypothetical protein
MGLDMSLFSTQKNNVISLKNSNKVSDFLDWEIVNEVGYWRKANHIHNWFVFNVQNNEDRCEIYIVSKEKLKELKSICEIVINDNNLASELLPTIDGFLFGSIDYNEYYFYQIEKTIEIIDNILNNVDFDKNYVVYYSSW